MKKLLTLAFVSLLSISAMAQQVDLRKRLALAVQPKLRLLLTLFTSVFL
ncbi:hypothetical protein [Pedobacter steynii]